MKKTFCMIFYLTALGVLLTIAAKSFSGSHSTTLPGHSTALVTCETNHSIETEEKNR